MASDGRSLPIGHAGAVGRGRKVDGQDREVDGWGEGGVEERDGRRSGRQRGPKFRGADGSALGQWPAVPLAAGPRHCQTRPPEPRSGTRRQTFIALRATDQCHSREQTSQKHLQSLKLGELASSLNSLGGRLRDCFRQLFCTEITAEITVLPQLDISPGRSNFLVPVSSRDTADGSKTHGVRRTHPGKYVK